VLTLSTDAGSIDLLSEVSGLGDFEQVKEVSMRLGGVFELLICPAMERPTYPKSASTSSIGMPCPPSSLTGSSSSYTGMKKGPDCHCGNPALLRSLTGAQQR